MVDYEGKNGDLDSYPDNFADDVYIVAYGVDGLVDTVDSEVGLRHIQGLWNY